MRRLITYTVYKNGEFLVSGSAKACAKAAGVTERTIKSYAEYSNPGNNNGITVMRNGDGDMTDRPIAERDGDESRKRLENMKRRRDELLGLNANEEWEL